LRRSLSFCPSDLFASLEQQRELADRKKVNRI